MYFSDNVLKLILFSCYLIVQVVGHLPPVLRIGIVVHEPDKSWRNDTEEILGIALKNLNKKKLFSNKTELTYFTLSDKGSVAHFYSQLCQKLKDGGPPVIGLLGSYDNDYDKFASSLSKEIGLPHVSMAPGGDVRESEAPKYFTVSLHPTQRQLLLAITNIVKSLKWNEISIIYHPTTGTMNIEALTEALEGLGASVTLHEALVDLRATFIQLRLKGSRNIIVDTGLADVRKVIQAALDTGMMTKSFTYLYTALDARPTDMDKMKYSEAKILSLEMLQETEIQKFFESSRAKAGLSPETLEGGRLDSDQAMLLDSLRLLVEAIEEGMLMGDLRFTNQQEVDCINLNTSDRPEVIEGVSAVFEAMKFMRFRGLTGPVSFINGKRSTLRLHVVQYPGRKVVGNWTHGLLEVSDGLHVIDPGAFDESLGNGRKMLTVGVVQESPCFTVDRKGEAHGYCFDLMKILSKRLDFFCDFKMLPDYGSFDESTGQWTGAISSLLRKDIDMLLSDMIVTSDRQKVVDFSVPFATSQLSVWSQIYPEHEMDGRLYAIINPLNLWAWISVILAFLIFSFMLRFVGWLSPYQKDEVSSECSSIGHDLSWLNSLWVLASSLVLRSPHIHLQAISSRTMTFCWWVFTMLVLMMYFAVLPTWLLRDGNPTIESVLSNLSERTSTRVLIKDSEGLMSSLERSVDPKIGRLWENLKEREPIRKDDLENHTKHRILVSLDRMILTSGESSVSQCQRFQHYEKFETDFSIQYSLGFSQDSKLKSKISEQILLLQEEGTLDALRKKWEVDCSQSKKLTQISFLHISPLLVLLAFGVVISILIAGCERGIYFRNKRKGFFRTATNPANCKIPMNGSATTCDTDESEH